MNNFDSLGAIALFWRIFREFPVSFDSFFRCNGVQVTIFSGTCAGLALLR
jgi:hypothetical protein